MYTKQDLLDHLKELGIDENGTLLVHSSMKSIGEVEGGADTVLDALIEYMKNGLLVFPTHTWSYIKSENPRFDVMDSPSCVGLLTELFRKRPGVIRSWHPTHSVAALGKGASDFVAGNEQFDTPCARGSSWGKLLDHKASILLIGVDLRRCTYIHGVEEWLDIPGRLTDEHEMLYTILPDNTEISVPQRRHIGHTSEKYGRVEDVFLHNDAMYKGHFGDATVRVCDTEKMTDLLTHLLKEDPELFS
ncbi:AAC(3) family N-acetyltransferase [Bacillus sinesaloumensis]|uniref:AAC(3) family N-acetyltransferase n=1 Tax=Litchfieldia sinesaloumensis TaxID=1926280 RepID=UPI0009885E50|nr:AAC(3) family N-acetyltransferase [Bacillus sinesaloumensis]